LLNRRFKSLVQIKSLIEKKCRNFVIFNFTNVLFLFQILYIFVNMGNQIDDYYKKYGYNTLVMGASFRNTGQILELAGCDLLTISPTLLDELENSTGDVIHKLNQDNSRKYTGEQISIDESRFRWLLNEDAMATEKLAEGIRNFTADTLKLEAFIAAQNPACD